MGTLQDAAAKIEHIAASLGSIDFSEEKEQISGAISSIQAELSAVAAEIRGGVVEENAPEPDPEANVETTPEDDTAVTDDEAETV